MDLATANNCINFFKAKPPSQEGGWWACRAGGFLTALLPLLSAPDKAAMRGNSEGLLDIEELIRRANAQDTDGFGDEWIEVRRYLALWPGLARTSDGQIAPHSPDPSRMASIIDRHEFVVTQITDEARRPANAMEPT